MTNHAGSEVSVDEFASSARSWLDAHARLRPTEDSLQWGVGSDSVSVFHELPIDAERALLQRICDWQRAKYDAGYGLISWPTQYGGAGLSSAHAAAFAAEEAEFDTPGAHELFAVTLQLIAPTIRELGSPELQRRLLGALTRGDSLACQLFSEPGAGSDLAGLATRAARDGDDWIISGQKVWSSGAGFAQWGELIARTDPDVPKHAGLTAFMLPLDTPGVDIRPLRQMSGASSFCEVFLDEVRIPDRFRLGDVGAGWTVALTTLGFERGDDARPKGIGGTWEQLLALARWLDRTRDPRDRQLLAAVLVNTQVAVLQAQRDHEARTAGAVPGAEGSLRKMHWVNGLRLISQGATTLLGQRIVADNGEWGTFAWTEHVLGAPGYRIAGGSDEIQRNIVAERILGLPQEPRSDRGPWRDIPR